MGGFAHSHDGGAVLGGGDGERGLLSLGFFLQGGPLLRCAADLAQGLIGHGVYHGAGGERNHHRAALPGDPEVQPALFAVAHAVLRVGGEAHVGELLLGKVVLHVLHADLLGGTEDDPQLPVAFHAGVFQGTQAVEGHHGGALVVRDAPAVGVVVVQHHGEGVGGQPSPAGTTSKWAMTHRVALALAVLGVGGVVVHVFRGEAVARASSTAVSRALAQGSPKGWGPSVGTATEGMATKVSRSFRISSQYSRIFSPNMLACFLSVGISAAVIPYTLTIPVFRWKVKSGKGFPLPGEMGPRGEGGWA